MFTLKRNRLLMVLLMMLMVIYSVLPYTAKAEDSRVVHEDAEVESQDGQAKLSSRLMDQFDDEDEVTFLVKFKQKADTDEAVQEVKNNVDKNSLSSLDAQRNQHAAAVSELKETAVNEQRNVSAYLEDSDEVEDYHAYFIVNGMAVTGSKEVATEIAAYPEVEKILPNEKRDLFPSVAMDGDVQKPEADLEHVEWNVEKVKAPRVWDEGVRGNGAVIASIDTGVEWDHPALKEKYRGYESESGDVDHAYSWFDATTGETEPYDDQGHGTHTVGTMVGSEADGMEQTEQIGVAPDASWMAVKAFEEDEATDEDLLKAAEWVLAPTDEDGDTRLEMAPDVVNNSWGGGPGLDEWYRDVVKEWRHANIFPVFAAGNVDSDNPGGPGSVATPANYPESFAVGATDIVDKLASFSLRGPSPYDEIKPDIVAPGQVIRSSIPGGAYAENNGTSMAAPAVSGVVGLMKSVDKTTSVEVLEEVLTSTAVSLTDEEYENSPNNGYGHGLVDALNAVSSVEVGVGALEGVVEDADGEPLDATVTLKGQNRSVSTSSSDGAYNLHYAAGTYDLVVEAYGYEAVEETVTFEEDETQTEDFTLEALSEQTIYGQVTDDVTGEAVEDAIVMLKEDGNVDPVSTDENGNYELMSFKGEYTLKVTAKGYEGAEVDVVIDEDGPESNVSLTPFYSYPGDELAYDDGTGEGSGRFHEAGSGWGVRMSLPEGKDKALVTEGKFLFAKGGGEEFQVEVFDASGPEDAPGEKIAGPIDATAINNGEDWTTIDLKDESIIVEDDFYMVYMQTKDAEDAPKLEHDRDGEFTERSWEGYHGNWYPLEPSLLTGNKMIRAVVDYEVEQPVIATPDDGDVTGETEIDVAGTATPGTEIQLMNNGEEMNEASVDDDGEFVVATALEQGENELTAVALVDGDYAGESESVTVTLNAEEPELTIDTPEQGGKLERDAVSVEGSVEANHLDFVEVNGEEAEVDDDRFAKRILLDEGENEIEVVAEDAAGNRTSETVTVEVKTDAPVIDELTPSEDVYVETGESVKIEFESEAGLDAVFSVHMPLVSTFGVMNATELPFMEVEDGHYVGYWTATDIIAEEAVLEVKVMDAFGNETYEEAEGQLFINTD